MLLAWIWSKYVRLNYVFRNRSDGYTKSVFKTRSLQNNHQHRNDAKYSVSPAQKGVCVRLSGLYDDVSLHQEDVVLRVDRTVKGTERVCACYKRLTYHIDFRCANAPLYPVVPIGPSVKLTFDNQPGAPSGLLGLVFFYHIHLFVFFSPTAYGCICSTCVDIHGLVAPRLLPIYRLLYRCTNSRNKIGGIVD